MPKHTPGPWKCSPVSSVVGSLVSYGDISKGESVASVMPQRNMAECAANARLIASAPDLLRILNSGYYLIDSAIAHVAHGGPTKAEAAKWIAEAAEIIRSAQGDC